MILQWLRFTFNTNVPFSWSFLPNNLFYLYIWQGIIDIGILDDMFILMSFLIPHLSLDVVLILEIIHFLYYIIS